jgi:ubiquinone/menaquinone biosynthesis C-methylase UbiE
MAISRYALARRYASGRRVLEIACGSGQGLGFVGQAAASIVGGDITESLLNRAKAHLQNRRIPLVRFDAHQLPFLAGSFDVIQLHEAIYYMRDPAGVFADCHRALGPGGTLIVTSINPDWTDFNPSAHAVRYLRAPDLAAMLRQTFASVDVRFGFPVTNGSLRDSAISSAKRVAVRLHIIPKTMGGKTWLKRLVFGRLTPVPASLADGFAPVEEPIAAPLDDAMRFRTIYAIARA